jgi:hypothetical protein
MALIERVCTMIGTPAPLQTLAAGAAEYDSHVAALIGDDDDMAEYLSRLEEIADDVDDGSMDSAEPVDPEELMNEVEQFLRDQE